MFQEFEGQGAVGECFFRTCPRNFSFDKKIAPNPAYPKNRGTTGTTGTSLCNQRLTAYFSVPTLSVLGTKKDRKFGFRNEVGDTLFGF